MLSLNKADQLAHNEARARAEALQDRGKHKEALELLRANLELSTRSLGPKHPTALNDQESVSDCLSEVGEFGEAVSSDRKTLQVRKSLDAKATDTLATQHSLAYNLAKLRTYPEAIELYRATLADRQQVLGKYHNDTLETRHELAACLHRQGQDKEASELNRAVLRTRERRLVADDCDLIASRYNLATNLHALGELDNAMKLIDVCCSALRDSRTKDESQFQAVLRLQGRVESELKQAAEKRRVEMQKIAEERRRMEDKSLREGAIKRAEADTAEEKRRLELQGIAAANMVKEYLEAISLLAREKAEAAKKSNAERLQHVEKESRRKELLIERQKAIHKEELSVRWPDKTKAAEKENEIMPEDRNNALSPSPSKSPKSKAKSTEDISTNVPSTNGLEVPTPRKPRSKSVGPSSKEPVVGENAQGSTYSDLCDAFDGGNDKEAIVGTESWLKQFKRTQSLLAQGRKPNGRKVKIAILDTGIDLGHADFDKLDPDHLEYGSPRKRVIKCKSFANNEGDRDVSGHGTHSAALLLKLAPKANLYVARVVEDQSNRVNPEAVAKAIMHATDEWKVDIISMSFGWSRWYRCVEEAIDHASSRDVILCAAASNDGSNKAVAFPANYPHVICVHSANGWGGPSHFTPPLLDVGPNFAVIGEAINSTWPVKRGEGHEKRMTGTSTSTPILAAIIALLQEFTNQKPVKTAHDLRLKTSEGITQVLLAMSSNERGYRVVAPWRVLDSQVTRIQVEWRILESMQKLFGPESLEQDGGT